MKKILNAVLIATVAFIVLVMAISPFIPSSIPDYIVVTRSVTIRGCRFVIGTGDDGMRYIYPSQKEAGDTLKITIK